MDDATRFEKAIFNWFYRRGELVGFATPLVVFAVVLAIGTVIVLAIAGRQPDGFVIGTFTVAAIAGLLLYLSAIFAIGTAASKSRRQKLLELNQTMRDIRQMSWREFEDLVTAYYSTRGYDVDHVGRDSRDGGVDVIARKGGETLLVQCKHYRDDTVDETPLRELLGLVTHRKATGGVLVTCGAFDDRALEFVRTSPEIELIGGEQLRSLVEEAVRGKHEPDVKCPVCGGPMTRKNGKYGEFLSCANFPACKGSRDLARAKVS